MANSKLLPSQGDSLWSLTRKLLQGFADGSFSSGGGGGGGAVTMAPGAVSAGAYSADSIGPGSISAGALSLGAFAADSIAAGAIGAAALATGAFSTGAISAGAAADGWDVTAGAKADAAATAGGLPGSFSIIALLKGILTAVGNALTVSQATAANLNATVVQGTADNLNATVVQATAANLNATVVQSTAANLKASVVGNVGGFTTVIKDTTAVSTSPAYSAGDAVGAKRTIANAVLAAGTGILESVTILDRANQKAAMTLFIFDADPTAATITDNAAFVFSTDDVKVIAQVSIAAADYVTTNSKAIAQKTGLGISLKAASGTSLFAALVTTGTPTYAATTDVQLEYGILQD